MTAGGLGEDMAEILRRIKKSKKGKPAPSPEAQVALNRLRLVADLKKDTMAQLGQEHVRALLEYIGALEKA